MKKIIILAISLLLFGCANIVPDFLLNKPAVHAAKKETQLSVADSLTVTAQEIRDEMKKLNAGGVSLGGDPVITGCAKRLVSIDFDGDAMLFIDDLRKSNFCDVRVIGIKPRQELILSLHFTKVPLWKILEDAGVQLGKMADITVAPQSILFTFGEKVTN